MSGITVFNTKKSKLKTTHVFGQPLGVQRYDGSKYPVFEKLTQQQLALLETRGSIPTERPF